MTSIDLRPDDPVVARLTRAVASLEPDPLFRRRLRGEVLNRHVAVREGLARADPPRRMGRLGRSVLIASFALAAMVGSVGAASQRALPGDPLYSVKRQIEEIRLQVAPAWMHAGLELAALDERLDEVERLAAAERWSDLAVAVDQAVAIRGELAAAGNAISGQLLAEHVPVLEELLTDVPEQARKGIQRALSASQGRAAPATAPPHPEHPAHPDYPAKPANASAPVEPAATSRPATTNAAPGNGQAARAESPAPSPAANPDRPSGAGSAPPSDSQ